KEGERVDWDKFVRNMKEHGVDPEDINYEVIIDATERPFDLEEITEMIEEGKKSGWTLFLGEQFIKFMKERFGIPFVLSDNWWTIMHSKKFLRKGEDPERRAAYASTFVEDEEDELPAFFDRYLEERLELFNEKTRTRIESDVIDGFLSEC
ncbi:MAG: hypothetical protein ACQERV_10375, partial [Bacteroidota bacterium]